jgi:hypothetical protein
MARLCGLKCIVNIVAVDHIQLQIVQKHGVARVIETRCVVHTVEPKIITPKPVPRHGVINTQKMILFWIREKYNV